MTSRKPRINGVPRSLSINSVSPTSPRKPSGSLSTRKMSGSNTSAVCWMIEARIASVCSMSSLRLSEVYSPFLSLITPGMRTKSTRERKSKLPIIGDPERISTDMPG